MKKNPWPVCIPHGGPQTIRPADLSGLLGCVQACACVLSALCQRCLGPIKKQIPGPHPRLQTLAGSRTQASALDKHPLVNVTCQSVRTATHHRQREAHVQTPGSLLSCSPDRLSLPASAQRAEFQRSGRFSPSHREPD